MLYKSARSRGKRVRRRAPIPGRNQEGSDGICRPRKFNFYDYNAPSCPDSFTFPASTRASLPLITSASANFSFCNSIKIDRVEKKKKTLPCCLVRFIRRKRPSYDGKNIPKNHITLNQHFSQAIKEPGDSIYRSIKSSWFEFKRSRFSTLFAQPIISMIGLFSFCYQTDERTDILCFSLKTWPSRSFQYIRKFFRRRLILSRRKMFPRWDSSLARASNFLSFAWG